MNIGREIRRERWFAAQFKEMPGGYSAACEWPGAPITAPVLGMVARGERRLHLATALWLAAVNDRPDLLRGLADMIDGHEGVGDLASLGHRDVYESARLAETIDLAEQDGIRTSGEIHEIRQHASANLQNAVELNERAGRLKSGPIED
mgnify:CR=1 FL=1|tara:strand:- start:11820 stop:12263 length:444 start_codon:yes stop_codon:yes gene_type:complete